MAEQTTSSYVVLRQVKTDAENAPVAWIEVSTVQARSQLDAIKSVADQQHEGIYNAVPARSWDPVKLTPKTVTTFSVDASVPPAPVAAPAAEVAS